MGQGRVAEKCKDAEEPGWQESVSRATQDPVLTLEASNYSAVHLGERRYETRSEKQNREGYAKYAL